MQSTPEGGRRPRGATAVADRLDRQSRVRHIGAQVREGTYRPPIDGVVESLVMALLPHFRARG